MAGAGIFVTGAGGFVGRHLLPVLAATGRSIVALDHSGRLSSSAPVPGVTTVQGDILKPETYGDALRSCDMVIHLAAATGRASAADHFAVNSTGTDTLLAESRKAGIATFLFVSSIATTFPRIDGYHYAQAKLRAEDAVRRSGLRFAILRPAIILGPNAPILGALQTLALLPVVVLPGSGKAIVQPIHVNDVARAVVTVVEQDLFQNEVFEIGGPEALTIEDLIRRLRLARTGRSGPLIHLPLWLLRAPLRFAEAAGAGRLLPITAGQLSSFQWHGIVRPNGLQDRIAPILTPVAVALASAESGPRAAVAELDVECRVFARHLVGADASPYASRQYANAHQVLPTLVENSAFDGALVRFARRNATFTYLADSYAAVLARDSLLRKKLVLLLAILETCPPACESIDRTVGGSRAVVVASLAAKGILGIVAFLAGLALLSPVRVYSLLRRGTS